MSFMRNYYPLGASYHDSHWSSFDRSNFSNNSNMSRYGNDNYYRNPNNFRTYADQFKEHFNYPNNVQHNNGPSLKRRKFSASSWGDSSRYNLHPSNAYYDAAPSTYSSSVPPAMRSDMDPSTSASCKRDRSKLEEEEQVLLSRDEIERCSPSRKDGIDAVKEAHLRYSYCAFIQNLGLRLELPQTTTGTAMVLCHRFFVRRSHACHDRFLIATAALFLAAKSEETPRPLNNVLRASSEILHTQDITFLSYILPVDWFEQYRERVLQAEHMILTTLNFELNVEHPYDPLTSVLNKLGLSQTVLVNMALNLVSEGGCTRLASRLYDIVGWWIVSMEINLVTGYRKKIATEPPS